MKQFFFTFIAIIFFISCEPEKPEVEPNRVSFTYSDEVPFVKVDFANSDKAMYTIKNIPGKDVFLVKANKSKTNTIGSSKTGEISSLASAKSIHTNTNSSAQITRIDHKGAMEFMANPPVINQNFLKNRSMRTNKSENSVHYGKKSPYSIGESKGFWVEDKSGEFVEISASLKGLGHFCYIWVADANFADTTGDGKVNQEVVDQLVAKFDGTSEKSWVDGIYTMVTNVFGTEFGGGPDGKGGRDGDQHISFLVYDVDYDYKEGQDSGTLGFFYAKDYYRQSELDDDPKYSHIKTNDAEMLYLDAFFLYTLPDMLISTLAHELQHLIHYNRKNIESLKNSSIWFNEMCSMVCEDLLAEKLKMSDEDSPFRWFSEFNSNYYRSGVNDWFDDSNKVRFSYASSYTFGAFLLRNYGGAELFKYIMANNNVDIGAILDGVTSYKFVNPQETTIVDNFDDIFEKYLRSIIYEDPAGFTLNKDQTTDVIAGVIYHVPPANIWNFSQKPSSGIMGPELLSPSTQVELRPLGFSIHSDNKWSDVSGDLTIQLTKSDDASLFYYLMVK